MDFFRFNKVYVIESLLGEHQTGKELYDDIIKRSSYYHSDLLTEFVEVLSLKDWNNTIKKIVQETKDNHVIPILHLELHGSNNHDGLVLADGNLVSWENFVLDMRCINIETQNNLFITMGICFGMDILYYISLEKPSPFLGVIGSLYPLQNDDIYIRYTEFYDEFLQSFDITKSLERLFSANPERPQEYSFVYAPELFRRIYQNYLKTQFSEEAIEKRINDSIQEVLLTAKKKKEFTRKFKKELRDTKDLYFRKYINRFLMRDKFESCRNRFKVPNTAKEFLSYNLESMML